MQDEDEATESIGETLSTGHARIAASRRIIDDLDRRLSRGSRLLDGDSEDEPPASD